MPGIKRSRRELAKARTQRAAKAIRELRKAAEGLDREETEDILEALQTEVRALAAIYAAPRDLFDFGARERPTTSPAVLESKEILGRIGAARAAND